LKQQFGPAEALEARTAVAAAVDGIGALLRERRRL
jgi:hypothetical protein